MEGLELMIDGHKYPLVKEIAPENNNPGIGYFSENGSRQPNLEQLRSIFRQMVCGLDEKLEKDWRGGILRNRTQNGSILIVYYGEEGVGAYKGNLYYVKGGSLQEMANSLQDAINRS